MVCITFRLDSPPLEQSAEGWREYEKLGIWKTDPERKNRGKETAAIEEKHPAVNEQ